MITIEQKRKWQQLHPRDWPYGLPVGTQQLWQHRNGYFLARIGLRTWHLLSNPTFKILGDWHVRKNQINPPFDKAENKINELEK